MLLHNKLMKQHLKKEKVSEYSEQFEHYLINTKTGECMCFDYIWMSRLEMFASIVTLH